MAVTIGKVHPSPTHSLPATVTVLGVLSFPASNSWSTGVDFLIVGESYEKYRASHQYPEDEEKMIINDHALFLSSRRVRIAPGRSQMRQQLLYQITIGFSSSTRNETNSITTPDPPYTSPLLLDMPQTPQEVRKYEVWKPFEQLLQQNLAKYY